MDKRPDIIGRLPVILITGFLGAGKTTLLNNLAEYLDSEGYRSAVLINEFGKINIDKELVDNPSDSIFEVNQGSVFCTCTRDQFLSAIRQISDTNPPFDVIVIEATGIARTADFDKYLTEAGFVKKIKFMQNICIIDAGNFHKVLETLPAIKNQVEEASICVINKTDTVSGQYLEELHAKLIWLNPDAVIVRTTYAEVDFKKLLDFSGTWTSKEPMGDAPPENITAVTIVSQRKISVDRLVGFIKKYEDKILRAKGFMRTEEGNVYLELAAGKITVVKHAGPYSGIGGIVLIGHDLDQAAIRREFKTLPDTL